MTSLDEQILVVEKDIVEVEIKIEAIEIAAADCTDLEEKKELRDEKKLILLNAKHHPTGIDILDG